MFGQSRSDTFNVVVAILPPERIVTRSKKRCARGEPRLLTSTAGELNEHVFHYHLPHEMQLTCLHIVYVSTVAACQFFVQHGFAHIDREQVTSMFASRVRVYPAIISKASQDQDGVDFDVDDFHPWQSGVRRDDEHVRDIDCDDASDDAPPASDNGVLSDVGAHADADETVGDDAEIDELSDINFDFDESVIDVVDGEMTWNKFISFTHAISSRCVRHGVRS